MVFQRIEEMFNRAWRLAFSRKKCALVFLALLGCGVLIVFCRTLSIVANPWVLMSLSFLPMFLCAGVLLGTGVLLTRIYYHEVQGNSFKWQRLLVDSFEVFMGAAYLSFPMILGYLVLWTLMGVFYLLRAIPVIGEGIGVLLSFGPFLLVFASLLLGLFALLLLFYATPHLALKKRIEWKVVEEVVERLRVSPLSHIFLLLIGVMPLLLVVGLLILAAVLTGMNYMAAEAVLGVSLQWFFIMIPFSLLLTPFVVFFFNFAMEGFLEERCVSRS